MKINKKIVIIICATLLILVPSVKNASMVELDDETADKQLKINQEKWEKEQEVRINKSSNNYLKYIVINGHELEPTFDKQTINYEIKEEINEDNIMIKAETEDDNASISGIGENTLKNGENNIRIDVTAENGMVRTYYIRVVKKEINNVSLNNIEDNQKTQDNNDDNYNNVKDLIDDNKFDNGKVMIIIMIILVIISCILIISKIKKR